MIQIQNKQNFSIYHIITKVATIKATYKQKLRVCEQTFRLKNITREIIDGMSNRWPAHRLNCLRLLLFRNAIVLYYEKKKKFVRVK